MTQNEIFGSAKWLTFYGLATPAVRAKFEAKNVSRAEIRICGLGLFELFINGKRVSDDVFVPAVSDYVQSDFMYEGAPFDEVTGHRVYVLKYDVTEYLKDGDNDLACALGPGFFATHMRCGDTDQYYGDVRLIYRLIWQDENGTEHEFVSDETAKCRPSRVTKSDFFRGEAHDLTALPADWTTGPTWQWKKVQLASPLDTEYFYQDCPADKAERLITPRLMNDFCGTRVYDCGENISGLVYLRDEGGKGELTQVRFSELTTPAGGLLEAQGHGQYFDVTGNGQGETVHPEFTWNAFRYFSVCGPMTPVCVAVVHADTPVTSDFKCSSRALTWLYDAYKRTQLNNLHGGIPSDCPHIERRGYTGDGQLTCGAAMLTLDMRAFYKKWLRDIADCQDRLTGHVQYTAPYTRCGGGPGGWGCAIAVVPYEYWKHYGDIGPLKEMYPGIQRYVDYLVNHSENGLVTSEKPGAWCLGDWCAPGRMRIPEPFVNTYFLIKTIDILNKTEDLLGIPYHTRAELRKASCLALANAYYDPQTGSFAQGEQGADAFALDIGLGGERTLENLVNKYEALGCLDTGIFGTEMVPRVLFEKGHADTALKLLDSDRPVSFAQWMKSGLTTLPEYWPGEYNRSFDHPMFGAVMKECFSYVLGIRQAEDSAGWERVVIAPAVTRYLPQAEGHITTPKGMISVKYTAQDGHGQADVTLPAGISCVWNGPGAVAALEPGQNIVRW